MTREQDDDAESLPSHPSQIEVTSGQDEPDTEPAQPTLNDVDDADLDVSECVLKFGSLRRCLQYCERHSARQR